MFAPRGMLLAGWVRRRGALSARPRLAPSALCRRRHLIWQWLWRALRIRIARARATACRTTLWRCSSWSAVLAAAALARRCSTGRCSRGAATLCRTSTAGARRLCSLRSGNCTRPGRAPRLVETRATPGAPCAEVPQPWARRGAPASLCSSSPPAPPRRSTPLCPTRDGLKIPRAAHCAATMASASPSCTRRGRDCPQRGTATASSPRRRRATRLVTALRSCARPNSAKRATRSDPRSDPRPEPRRKRLRTGRDPGFFPSLNDPPTRDFRCTYPAYVSPGWF